VIAASKAHCSLLAILANAPPYESLFLLLLLVLLTCEHLAAGGTGRVQGGASAPKPPADQLAGDWCMTG